MYEEGYGVAQKRHQGLWGSGKFTRRWVIPTQQALVGMTWKGYVLLAERILEGKGTSE